MKKWAGRQPKNTAVPISPATKPIDFDPGWTSTTRQNAIGPATRRLARIPAPIRGPRVGLGETARSDSVESLVLYTCPSRKCPEIPGPAAACATAQRSKSTGERQHALPALNFPGIVKHAMLPPDTRTEPGNCTPRHPSQRTRRPPTGRSPVAGRQDRFRRQSPGRSAQSTRHFTRQETHLARQAVVVRAG